MSMSRVGLFLLVIGLLFAAPLARAEDKAKAKARVQKPIGAWTREANGTTVTFDIKEDGMTIHVKNDEGKTITAEAEYAVTKGGVLFGTITKVTKEGIDAPTEKGDLFSVAISVKGKELTVSDLKGTHANEEASKLIEGVYKKK
jgi:hypothetical protein